VSVVTHDGKGVIGNEEDAFKELNYKNGIDKLTANIS
jgi:hypothetical protein